MKQSDAAFNKQYETYKKWYKKAEEANFMRTRMLSKEDFKKTAMMYKAAAKLTLTSDKDDVIAKRTLKNVARTIAYDQKDISELQLEAIKTSAKELKVNIKMRDVKKGGFDKLNKLLEGKTMKKKEINEKGEEIELERNISIADLFDIGSV